MKEQKKSLMNAKRPPKGNPCTFPDLAFVKGNLYVVVFSWFFFFFFLWKWCERFGSIESRRRSIRGWYGNLYAMAKYDARYLFIIFFSLPLLFFFSWAPLLRNDVFERNRKGRCQRRILYRSVCIKEKKKKKKTNNKKKSNCFSFSDPVLFRRILKWYEDLKQAEVCAPLLLSRAEESLALSLSEEAEFFAIPLRLSLPPKKVWIAALCFQVKKKMKKFFFSLVVVVLSMLWKVNSYEVYTILHSAALFESRDKSIDAAKKFFYDEVREQRSILVSFLPFPSLLFSSLPCHSLLFSFLHFPFLALPFFSLLFPSLPLFSAFKDENLLETISQVPRRFLPRQHGEAWLEILL